MSRNIANELNHYLRTPPVTFEKGLMHTDNDSALGYVSKLHNMEINNGVVERREGTKVLSNPDSTNKYIFMKEMIINGVHFILGITETREVKVFLDHWTEKEIGVYKKGIFPLSPSLGVGFKFQFFRGEKFWLIEDNKYYKLINDFGDAARFNKHGYVQFFWINTSDDLYQNTVNYIPHQKIELARDSTSQIGLYLEITDISHKTPPVDVIKIKDPTKQTPEIRGDVRFAAVNEAGYRGLWSPPIFLSKWESVYFSKNKGLFLNYAKTKRVFKSASNVEEFHKVKDAGVFVSKDLSLADSKKIIPVMEKTETEFDYTFFTERYKYSEKYPYGFDSLDINCDFFIDLQNKKIFLFTSTVFIDNKGYNYHLNKVKDIHFLLKNLQCLSFKEDILETTDGREFLTSSCYDRFSGIDIHAKLQLQYTNMKTCLEWKQLLGTSLTYDSSETPTNTNLFELSLNDSDISKIREIIGGGRDCSMFMDGVTITSNDATMGTCSLKVETPVLFSSGFTKTFETFKLKQNIASFFNEDSHLFLKEKGLNLWEKISSGKTTIVSIDNTDVFLQNASLTSTKTDLMMFESDVVENSGFAVWNDDFIKAVSQEFLQKDISNCNPLYQISDGTNKKIDYSSSDTGRVCNQTPDIYKRGAMFVNSMRDTKLMRSSHILNFMEESIKQPSHIVNNVGVVFVVQGKKIWIGSQDSLILNSYVAIDYTVEYMQPLYNGVLLVTSKGLKFLDKKGSPSQVDSRQIKSSKFKATCVGSSEVFGITESEEVVSIRMVFNGDSKPYAKAISLSNAIHIQWTDSPKMEYVSDTLWIARTHDIFGFKDGGWKTKQVFTQTINNLSQLNGELVVAFYGAVKRDDIQQALVLDS